MWSRGGVKVLSWQQTGSEMSNIRAMCLLLWSFFCSALKHPCLLKSMCHLIDIYTESGFNNPQISSQIKWDARAVAECWILENSSCEGEQLPHTLTTETTAVIAAVGLQINSHIFASSIETLRLGAKRELICIQMSAFNLKNTLQSLYGSGSVRMLFRVLSQILWCLSYFLFVDTLLKIKITEKSYLKRCQCWSPNNLLFKESFLTCYSIFITIFQYKKRLRVCGC